MNKKERRERTEQRRLKLVEMLSAADNARSLNKIIWDKILILAGLLSIMLVSIWLLCMSIIPLSFFGLIGKEQRIMYGYATQFSADQLIGTSETGIAIAKVNTSAFNAAWNNLTFRTGGISTSIYDIWSLHDQTALKFWGGLGCTLLFIGIIVCYCIIISIYARDLLLVGKTLIYISKENNKDTIDDMKKALNDVRKLYSDETNENTAYIEESKKIPEEQKVATKVQKVQVQKKPVKTVQKQVKPIKKNEKPERRVDTEDTVTVEETVEVPVISNVQTNSGVKHELNYDDLSMEEIDALANGKVTEEELLVKYSK